MAGNYFDQFDAAPAGGNYFDRFDAAREKRMAALPKSLENAAEIYSPTDGMSAGRRFAAGAGKAVVDIGRGLGQMAGLVSNDDVAASRSLDAPLMNTAGGKFGNFAGNVAVAAPTAFVPGANTVTGAALIGGGLGLAQPAESAGDRIKAGGAGLVFGAGGQALGKWAAPKIGRAISSRTAAAAESKGANSVRDATLAEARKLGYRVPPATINQQSVTARAAESLAGKGATQQTAAVRNQQVTNRLVREEFGLSKSAPLSIDTLKGIRKAEGRVYEAVKKSGDIMADRQYLSEIDGLASAADEIAADFPGMNFAGSAEIQQLQKSLGQQGFSANGAVEVIKKLRSDASKNLAWNVEDPSRKALGLAQREAAGIVEDQVIRHLRAQGKDAVADAFDKSRTTIAKTYSVQSALNDASGNVVAPKLAAQLRKGKPLSGNLEKIARFAATVDPAVAREQLTSPGVSKLMAGLASAGGIGGVATGNLPLVAGSVALPVAGELSRRAMLSSPFQRLAAPSYRPGNALLELSRYGAPLSAPVAIGLANTE